MLSPLTWALVAAAAEQHVIVVPYDPARPNAPTRAVVTVAGGPPQPAPVWTTTWTTPPPGQARPAPVVQPAVQPRPMVAAQQAVQPRAAIVAQPAVQPRPVTVTPPPVQPRPMVAAQPHVQVTVAPPPVQPRPAPVAPPAAAPRSAPVAAPPAARAPVPQARPPAPAPTSGLLDLDEGTLDFESSAPAPKPRPAPAPLAPKPALAAPRPAPAAAPRPGVAPAPAPAPRPAAAPQPAPAAPAGPSFDELMDLLDEPLPLAASARTPAPVMQPRPAPAPAAAPTPRPPEVVEESFEFENTFAGSADRYAAEQQAAAAEADAKKPFVPDAPGRAPNVSMPGPKPCLDPMSSGGDDATLEGVGLSASATGNALRPFLPKVASCLPHGTRGQFEVTASFQVGCDGRVTSLEIADPGGLPPQVISCLEEALRKAPFPAHDRQGGEAVELPLHFTGDATEF